MMCLNAEAHGGEDFFLHAADSAGHGPRKLISPVMAVSERTRRRASNEASAATIATPALGPSSASRPPARECECRICRNQ
jgi:hypothetical protein